MKSKTPKLKVALTLVAAVVLTSVSRAAVVVSFGETVPTSNIITSFEPVGQGENAWFNDGPTKNGIRLVSQSFITPSSSDFSLSAITMKLNSTLATSFPSATPISIDFYQISLPGDNPIGTYLTSWGANIQPTTSNATAGSYFTFTSDIVLNLTAGASYAYVLAFDVPDPSHLFRLSISQGAPDQAGTRAWQNTNGGGWADTGETYVYYIQGTAATIPEPSTMALFGLTAVGALWINRRRSVAKLG